MKKAVVLGVALACAAGMARGEAKGSAVPAGFAYQGVLSDPVAGALTGMQTVTFRLFAEASGGNPLWETNQVVACSAEGLFHAWLEGGDAMLEAFLKPDADNPFARYLELEVEGHGGAIAPRVEFTSVPQALLARCARQSATGFAVAGTLEGGEKSVLQVVSNTANFVGSATFSNLDVRGDATWSDSAPLNVTGTLTAGDFEGVGFAPSGCIAMWASTNDIPDGWALCDGTRGTPDLRDCFPVGVLDATDTPPYATTNAYPYGATGGVASVTLEVGQMPPHTHAYTVVTSSSDSAKVESWGSSFLASSSSSQNSGSAGGGAPHENLPPYVALYFIMKL
ncbi:MAG: hypothetical protein IK066_07440 [Kiritimatiellae bacterium]|nr:hypothetical protein [Kiritimatiellia bacterium]